MITPWHVYWITRCDKIYDTVTLMGLISMAFFLISCGCAFGLLCESHQEKWRKLLLRKLSPVSLVCGVVLLTIGMLVPTTKEMCAIIAIPAVVNNEQVQEIPDKIVDLAGEWIDELRPTKDENKGSMSDVGKYLVRKLTPEEIQDALMRTYKMKLWETKKVEEEK